MRKFLTKQALIDLGWTGVDVGKGYIVSYCEICDKQGIHHCTGKKDDNGHTILRFECAVCFEKLNGGQKNATNFI